MNFIIRCYIISGGRGSGWSGMFAAGGTGLWVWDWDDCILPAAEEEGDKTKWAPLHSITLHLSLEHRYL